MGKKKQQRAQERKTQRAQQQQQMEPYMALVDQGFRLEQSGDHQAAGDKYRQAVQEAPSVWSLHRFFAFNQWILLKSGDRYTYNPTQDEIDYVKQVLDNEEEPAHFRSHAAFWYSGVYNKGAKRNYCISGEVAREGLDIIRNVPEEDKSRIVVSGRHFRVTGHDVTVKELLDCTAGRLERILAIIEGESSATVENPEGALLMQRSRAAGNSCDCCGKTLEELQADFFERCTRCQMVFYCSEACQREHWKRQGHKKACRAPGQIEVGDDMMLVGDGSDPVYIFKVIARVEETTNRWQVEPYKNGDECVTLDGDDFITVDGDDLSRLRPPPTV
jgi:MYND finger